MKTLVTFLVLSSFIVTLAAQEWIDTSYTIQTEHDKFYGTAPGYAGTTDSLFLDISYPEGDTPPACGRPLLLVIHGGAWVGGDKALGNLPRIRRDFAKRGYVTASISYRLGQFNTNQGINCNVPGWNCYNMTDTSEWYRANFRGIQDARGALRYLINQAEEYQIDPYNVFLTGESAGGFIAMGVGFIDHPTEILSDLVAEYPDAPRPNQLYENTCPELMLDIDSMNLSRPALGSDQGTLHQPAGPYQIQAVGNLYGGSFNNIFRAYTPDPPALYLFHQPCDLIVPYRRARLLAGYVNCLLGFPANCGYIVNRPIVYGSRGIAEMIDTLMAAGLPTSEYLLDNTTNNYNCIQQLDPLLSCHAIDNYWLRTTNMATYFASQIDTSRLEECIVFTQDILTEHHSIPNIYPNPVKTAFTIEFSELQPQVTLVVTNSLGQIQLNRIYDNFRITKVEVAHWKSGIYLLHFRVGSKQFVKKIVLTQ